MQLFIYRIRPTRVSMLADGPSAEEARVIGEHFEYLQELAALGRLFMAGRTLTDDEDAFGIAVFAAASPDQAQAVLAQDPAVLHGVMEGDVFPFRVALWSGDPLALSNGS